MFLYYVSFSKHRKGTLNYYAMGWRDGSAVKSIYCSSEDPEFKSQQPHGGSQPSIVKSDVLFGVSEDSYSVLTYNNK